MARKENRKQALKRASVNSGTGTEKFLIWKRKKKKRKKGNSGLYLKDDYKTRDADGPWVVYVLWPYFLEQYRGMPLIRFDILDYLNIFRTGIGEKLIRRFFCRSDMDCVYRE